MTPSPPTSGSGSTSGPPESLPSEDHYEPRGMVDPPPEVDRPPSLLESLDTGGFVFPNFESPWVMMVTFGVVVLAFLVVPLQMLYGEEWAVAAGVAGAR